jgi:plasmid stability protein
MKSKEPKPAAKSRPLNLRDFPDDLYWKVKVRAAEEHVTLKQFVVQSLQRVVAQ